MMYEDSGTPVVEYYGELKVPMEKAIDYLKQNYSEAWKRDSTKLVQMVRDLATGDNVKILNWGKSVLHAQSYFVNEAAKAVSVFNGLEANKLLEEVMEAAKAKAFLSMFVKRPNKQYYIIQIKSLTVRLENVRRVVDDLLKNIRELNLVEWVATLAATSESATAKDNVSFDTLYNRRMLMLQALQSLETARTQLEIIQSMIYKIDNEIEHVNHVIIPSLNLFGVKK